MKSRIFLKLMGGAVLLVLIAATVLDVSIRRLFTASLERQMAASVEQKVALFAGRLPSLPSNEAQAVADQVSRESGCDAAVLDTQGQQIAAADTQPQANKNKAEGFQSATRQVFGGSVRLSCSLAGTREEVANVRRILLWNSLLALVIAGLFAGAAAWNISRRLRRIMLFAERMSAGYLSARVADETPDEIGKLASALDATAQTIEQNFKEIAASRAQLESLLNSLQDAVFAVDSTGRILWANGTMNGVVRVRIGDRAGEVVRDPEVIAAIELARAGKATSSQRAFAVMPGRAYQVSAAPLPPNGAVVLLHDITQIERLENMRRDFVANVSHELRTPLTMIQGYAETLRDNGQDSSGFLEIICRNAARMTRLTEDLLMLARVESGELKLQPAPVPASELLEDAFVSFAAIAQSKNVRLQVERTTEQLVKGDKDAIHQVFSNLIANALNYADGTPSIEIGAEANDSKQVDFWVRDHGAGIGSEHQPRLFERFYRIDRARSRDTGGTGL
ncbi:MAG: HAMP domain-containing protein, partial [Acidobacteriales bacterium]|nr:HAMP domain-containing protein [Terriglobales bacterium]